MTTGDSPKTHRLVFWHTCIDHVVVYRALLSRDMLVDVIVDTRLSATFGDASSMQSSNLLHIIRKTTNPSCMKLAFVYSSLCIHECNLAWHTADADTLGLAPVIDFARQMPLDQLKYISRENLTKRVSLATLCIES